MTSIWAPTHFSWEPDSGRILDTARGILIGLRRCPSEAAFDELHSAAQRIGFRCSRWPGRWYTWPVNATQLCRRTVRGSSRVGGAFRGARCRRLVAGWPHGHGRGKYRGRAFSGRQVQRVQAGESAAARNAATMRCSFFEEALGRCRHRDRDHVVAH